jgi:hypothetical protein
MMHAASAREEGCGFTQGRHGKSNWMATKRTGHYEAKGGKSIIKDPMKFPQQLKPDAQKHGKVPEKKEGERNTKIKDVTL